MRIVPKFQQGGDFTSLFTEYQYIPYQNKKTQSSQPVSSSKRAKSDDDDDTKGKLTEKDLFQMIKEIDGLPNEMNDIMGNLIRTFRMQNLIGMQSDLNDLATTYLKTLQKVKIAKQNKDKYDKAIETAKANGAMEEPAMTSDGSLVAVNEKGNIINVDLDTYMNNKNDYKVLSVSEVAQLRAYNPKFKYTEDAFNIINNSMGFKSLLKDIDDAVGTLGKDTMTYNSQINSEAAKGLELLKSLSENDRILAANSITLKGLYKTTVTDKSQQRQINAALAFIERGLTPRAKAFAAWKLGTSDTKNALHDLVLTHLISKTDVEHTFDINYKGALDHVTGNNSKDGSSSDEDPKEGYWKQVQTGKAGSDSSFNILKYNGGSMSVDGKLYGKVPNIDKDCSLTEFLNKSEAGYIIDNAKNITFGNIQLSTNSFNDIMVKAGSGMYRVILPSIKGKVWIEAAEVYGKFVKELKRSGVKPDTQQYLNKVKELLSQPQYEMLSPIIASDGKLTPENSQTFLVLEGLGSSRTAGVDDDNNQKSLDKFDTTYLRKTEDDNLYQNIDKGLSSKDNGEYGADEWNWYSPSDWFGFYDKLYEGNIYIPINNNPINSQNADDNDIKASTSKAWEELNQNQEKVRNLQSTSAKALEQ